MSRNAAPFAAAMRFIAMLPDASTRKIVNDPARRDMRLFRRSSLATITRFDSGGRRNRRRRKSCRGAAARSVASMATRLITPPRGNTGLTYLPRSSEKTTFFFARPARPGFRCSDCVNIAASAGSSVAAAASSGAKTSSGGISSSCFSSSRSSSSSSSGGGGVSSSSSSSSPSFSSSSSPAFGDGGGGGGAVGGGGGGVDTSNGAVARGAMANATATFRSPLDTLSLPRNAADARAIFAAKISGLWP
eukprot:30706-Pelagococcus_subviridis.AAC.7